MGMLLQMCMQTCDSLLLENAKFILNWFFIHFIHSWHYMGIVVNKLACEHFHISEYASQMQNTCWLHFPLMFVIQIFFV